MAVTGVLEKLLGIVEKRVPDKNAQAEIALEFAKLDTQLTGQRDQLLKSDIIRWTFPALVGVIVFGYAWNILSGIIWSLFDMSGEKYLFDPPTELLDFLKWYCGGFFGARVVGEYTKGKTHDESSN
jgi:hypothetical protein